MIRKLMLMGLLVTFLSMATSAMAEDVFRTKNGKKYHKEVCRLIKNKNAVKIDKDEALEEGLQPCKVCFKEDIDQDNEDSD